VAPTSTINDRTKISELTVAQLKELIREVVDTVIEERVKVPNRITRETLDKADREEDLNYYSSIDEFFKKMGV